jgi:hypothetical protein
MGNANRKPENKDTTHKAKPTSIRVMMTIKVDRHKATTMFHKAPI